MKHVQFAISTDPASSMHIVYDSEKLGVFVRVTDKPSMFELHACLLSAIQGLYFELDNDQVTYLPASCIPSYKRKFSVPKKSTVDLSWDTLLKEHTIARSSELEPRYKVIARYRFAFQQEFPIALHGPVHGRALCLLEYLGFKEIMCIRTPFCQYLLSCKNTTNDKLTNVLVVPCTRYKDIIKCPCMYWGKTLLDRIDFVMCVSDEAEDRWLGFHWIPKSAILEQKIISTLGYPGKSEFALQTLFPSPLKLWTDPFMVKF